MGSCVTSPLQQEYMRCPWAKHALYGHRDSCHVEAAPKKEAKQITAIVSFQSLLKR